MESLEETLAVLSDPRAMEQIRESEAEWEQGDAGVSLGELRAELAARKAGE